MIERGLIREDRVDSDGQMLRLLSITLRGRELARAIRQTRERLDSSKVW
jgi:DNA-binding MarR family transcriptional regulator